MYMKTVETIVIHSWRKKKKISLSPVVAKTGYE